MTAFAHSGRQVSTYRQTRHQRAAGLAVTPVVDKRALLPPSARLPRGTGGWVVLLCRSLNISCRPICERDTPFDKLTIISLGTHSRGPVARPGKRILARATCRPQCSIFRRTIGARTICHQFLWPDHRSSLRYRRWRVYRRAHIVRRHTSAREARGRRGLGPDDQPHSQPALSICGTRALTRDPVGPFTKPTRSSPRSSPVTSLSTWKTLRGH